MEGMIPACMEQAGDRPAMISRISRRATSRSAPAMHRCGLASAGISCWASIACSLSRAADTYWAAPSWRSQQSKRQCPLSSTQRSCCISAAVVETGTDAEGHPASGAALRKFLPSVALASPYAADNSTNDRKFVFVRIEDLTRSTVRLLSPSLRSIALLGCPARIRSSVRCSLPSNYSNRCSSSSRYNFCFRCARSCSIASRIAPTNSSLR
jgi:hypothetical protein